LRAHAKLPSDYFIALKVVASVDAAAPTGSALKGLATSLNDLNTKLAGAALLKDKNVNASENLGQWIGDAYKGHVLGQVLKRDARVITDALEWQDLATQTLSENLTPFLERDRSNTYRETIATPFSSLSIAAPAAWVEARRKALLRSAAVEQIDAANRASKSMREVWQQILAGTTDPALAIATLEHTRKLNVTLAELAL
jgi:hypothetical protein